MNMVQLKTPARLITSCVAAGALAAALSAFIGCKMLRKQFEKAGITK